MFNWVTCNMHIFTFAVRRRQLRTAVWCSSMHIVDVGGTSLAHKHIKHVLCLGKYTCMLTRVHVAIAAWLSCLNTSLAFHRNGSKLWRRPSSSVPFGPFVVGSPYPYLRLPPRVFCGHGSPWVEPFGSPRPLSIDLW